MLSKFRRIRLLQPTSVTSPSHRFCNLLMIPSLSTVFVIVYFSNVYPKCVETFSAPKQVKITRPQQIRFVRAPKEGVTQTPSSFFLVFFLVMQSFIEPSRPVPPFQPMTVESRREQTRSVVIRTAQFGVGKRNIVT